MKKPKFDYEQFDCAGYLWWLKEQIKAKKKKKKNRRK